MFKMAESMEHSSGATEDSSGNVTVSLESTTEWRLQEILLDGTEKYMPPPTFADHVARMASKIEWKRIAGDPNQQFDADCSDGAEDEAEKSAIAEAENSAASSADGRGPWENVAKNLHQALIEMNVLLDVVQIAHEGRYMVFDPVDSMCNEQFGPEPSKMQMGVLFTFKKKVMSQGQKLFENIVDRLTKLKHSNAQTKEPDFQAELIELRQAWRLKKMGNTILGDLSYRNYGPKFKPNSTFEIRKNQKLDYSVPIPNNFISSQSALEIILPKGLEQTACLKICIERNCGTLDQQRNVVDFSSSSKVSGMPLFKQEAFFKGLTLKKPYLRPGIKAWQQRLEVAQRTLLCRDLFAQLSKEAVHLYDMCCVVRGDSVTLNLADGYVLKIMLITDQEMFAEKPNFSTLFDENNETVGSTSFGNFVLEHSLYQMFCDDLETGSAPVIPRPIVGPMILSSRRLRMSGPEALHVTSIGPERPLDRILLLRLIERANHYTLLMRCREGLRNFARECMDPSVTVHWSPESTGVWSLAKISMITPYYESCHRTSAIIEINVNSIIVTLKDGEELKFGTNVQDLLDYFQILAKQHLISAVGVLARHLNWNSLYCSLTSVNRHGRLAPTILLSNTWGTKSVCVKCPRNSDPEIYVQNTMKSRDQFLSDLLLNNDLWTNMRGEYRSVAYQQLIGRCFLQKMELLISALS